MFYVSVKPLTTKIIPTGALQKSDKDRKPVQFDEQEA